MIKGVSVGMGKRLIVAVISFGLLCHNFYAACDIKVDSANKGIVKVNCTSSNGGRLKVRIEKGSGKYTYDLTSGTLESFPLQMGNGEYKVTVLENSGGDKYQIVGASKVTAQMADEKVVYLGSVQNVKWTPQNQSIQYGFSLTKGNTAIIDKAKTLYNYMVGGTYRYDYNKLASLPSTYLPSIDRTYQEKTGICYDFSALFAAMLRSQGIYAKLVTGYTPNAEGFHAWNEVYDEGSKTWLIIDTTYDLQVISKKSVNMSKLSKEYSKVYEY